MAKQPATPTTAPATAATIQLVPVKHLRESPFNPRKTYGATALAELAESIKAQGILQPIVARDLPAGQQDIWVRHEIVFGHRRFRAAQLAGLEEVPVVVRPFTNEQAALAQVAENLQRQDVTAFEEADSFARLHREHEMTADQIAAGVNKSRSYVYGRLKLAKVAPEVRTAVTDDGLGAEAALEVARLPSHALQKVALKNLRGYDGEWLSFRDAKRRVRDMFRCDTAAAPFDIHDVTLAKLAGPCHTCPKRAGNDPDLQGVLDADVCTDSECFQGKTNEHFRIELIAMGHQGHKTLRNEEADAFDKYERYSAPQGYTGVNEFFWVGSERVEYRAMLDKLAEAGKDLPKTLAVHRKGWSAMREFLTDEQADQVLGAYRALVGADAGDADTPSTAARAAHGGGFRFPNANLTDTTDWTPAERAVVGDGWMRVKEAVLRNLASLPRTADDMRVILLREYDQADGFGPISEILGLDAEQDAAEKAWEEEPGAEPFSYRDWWETKLASLPPDTLATLLLGATLWDFLGYGGRGYSRAQATAKVALAERYGVDVVAASQPEVKDDAGHAGGPRAQASAVAEQLDAFGGVPA